MQNNLMKMEDEFYEENEINIYDLINIFLKNIIFKKDYSYSYKYTSYYYP